MIPPEAKGLVDSLIAKSRAKEVAWTTLAAFLGRNAGVSDDYVVNFANYSVNVWEWDDEDSMQDGIGFAILNDQGKQMWRFSTSAGDRDYTKMYDLFTMAKSKALNLEDVFNKLLKAVETPGVVGEKRIKSSPASPGEKPSPQ